MEKSQVEKKHDLSQLAFTNRYYQLSNDFYQFQLPTAIKKPFLININPLMLKELGMDLKKLDEQAFINITSGNELLDDSEPVASIYAGHQFGYFVPQLGDGRAILLGEVKGKFKGQQQDYWELQLKGAGKTPFSRDGDGRAVLRSTIREYLCSEAMAALGVASTRSLAMVGSEEEVYRESIEMGSVMIRMAPSFIRFGSFELFASRGQDDKVKELADFVLSTYYPSLLKTEQSSEQQISNKNPYQLLFEKVVINTAELIAKWQSIGFAHGVMNTDNMSILGLTIDYGPFGFLDNFDQQFICNYSDHQGRYRFENQPYIGFWNLNCLARAMSSLLSIEEVKQSLSLYQQTFNQYFSDLMHKKLGLFNRLMASKEEESSELIFSLLQLMQDNQIDYSLFFRKLSNYSLNQDMSELNQLPEHQFEKHKAFNQWFDKYDHALACESLSPAQRKEKMDNINPKYILRNYIAQMVIEKAENKNYQFLDQWLKVLQTPYDEHPEMEKFAALPPQWANKISVSCSS
jgi:uncharacterized protein YdiU (UPF0061 family)